MRIIDTYYDPVAAVADDGTEYIAIPTFDGGALDKNGIEKSIFIYKLPSGGATLVQGRLTLPEDAEEVYSGTYDDALVDWEYGDTSAVYDLCEKLLLEM